MQTEYKDENHSYWLEGQRILGVSEILNCVGLINGQYFTEKSATVGTDTHSAIYYLLEDDLVVESVGKHIQPYFDAFNQFVIDTGFKPQAGLIEKPLIHPLLRFGGRPDWPGYINGKAVYIDGKTGAMQPHHAIQTAAYKILLRDVAEFNIDKRYGLYLSNTGKYKLQEYSDKNDEKIFLAALSIAMWKGVYIET